jgi:hypothetical protein
MLLLVSAASKGGAWLSHEPLEFPAFQSPLWQVTFRGRVKINYADWLEEKE